MFFTINGNTLTSEKLSGMPVKMICLYWLFKQSEDKHEVLLVPLLVVLKTIWVLQSIYDIAR